MVTDLQLVWQEFVPSTAEDPLCPMHVKFVEAQTSSRWSAMETGRPGFDARSPNTLQYTRSTCSLNPWVRSLVGLITSAGTGEYFPHLRFTCRNCGDRGHCRPSIVLWELHRAKIVLSPVWCSWPTTGVPLAHATMNFVGLDLTTSDRDQVKNSKLSIGMPYTSGPQPPGSEPVPVRGSNGTEPLKSAVMDKVFTVIETQITLDPQSYELEETNSLKFSML
ncbi:hypothetical protein TNCV_3526031 [Trichonephila clavipes]|nr:hypothetical protein TNCV_3526031 [Trichonephila clavipes]